MGDDPEAAQERAAIQYMMRRLDEFTRGLGLDEATTRQIVEKVATDMPMRTDEERLIRARTRMIEASAEVYAQRFAPTGDDEADACVICTV